MARTPKAGYQWTKVKTGKYAGEACQTRRRTEVTVFESDQDAVRRIFTRENEERGNKVSYSVAWAYGNDGAPSFRWVVTVTAPSLTSYYSPALAFLALRQKSA